MKKLCLQDQQINPEWNHFLWSISPVGLVGITFCFAMQTGLGKQNIGARQIIEHYKLMQCRCHLFLLLRGGDKLEEREGKVFPSHNAYSHTNLHIQNLEVLTFSFEYMPCPLLLSSLKRKQTIFAYCIPSLPRPP